MLHIRFEGEFGLYQQFLPVAETSNFCPTFSKKGTFWNNYEE